MRRNVESQKQQLERVWEQFYPPRPYKGKTEPWESLKMFVDFLHKEGVNSGKVIDAGCGYGAEAIHMAKEGFEVIVIDINREARRFAIERAGREGSNICKFINQNTTRLYHNF